jgi:hypothetical protein
MPWRDACTPYFEGWVVGNSPLGGCRGDGENAKGVTAIRQVAGANLAYRFLHENVRCGISVDLVDFVHKS